MLEPLTYPNFYQAHLDRVSRSFAFCIARLESPMRERVALGYLLCRIVDTVEDAGWAHFQAQEKAFQKFDEFLSMRPSAETVAEWRKSFPKKDVSEGEALLLDDAYRIFSDFHDLPQEARSILLEPTLSMSAGMRHFMKRRDREGELRLRNVSDVNRYCFFVAGVVGEMLSGFAGSYLEGAKTNVKDAFRFGLFLQKINLLKDQDGDEKQGRFLVPSREVLRRSLAQDAEIAFRYLRSLPDRAPGFRLFCAWSLFLGLASLPWIEKSQGTVEKAKLPREEAGFLLAAIEYNILDQRALDELFVDLKAAAHLNLERPIAEDIDTKEETELLGLYSGRLVDDEVLDLFHGG
jgi:phytoene/squalene synthetase